MAKKIEVGVGGNSGIFASLGGGYMNLGKENP
jgi:hypothetical protein